jgi:hypothetical protein
MVQEFKNSIGEAERIDATDETQCEHWSAEFGVSTEELRHALLEAGSNRVADVRAYFRNRANRRLS